MPFLGQLGRRPVAGSDDVGGLDESGAGELSDESIDLDVQLGGLDSELLEQPLADRGPVATRHEELPKKGAGLVQRVDVVSPQVNEDDLATGGSGGKWIEKLRVAVQSHHEEAEIVPFSAKFEAELGELTGEERREYLASAGVSEPGLDRLIHAGYRLLGLQTFFTVGENEVRAWTMHRGDTAFAAAGEIHSDFQRGFIRAETVGYNEFVKAGSYKIAREQGLVRSEGRDYVVKDGDILLFRFNV